MRLADEAALAGSDLDVRADGDRVLLSGSVPTDTARDYAARVVGSTPGVRAVESRLELGTPREIVSITDDDLASDVTYLLGLEFEGVEAGDDPIVGWRVDGGAWEFLVGVEDREVTLDGSVPDAHEVRRAVETAWRVPGVRRVRAELELVGDRVSPPTYVGGESAEADLGAVR